MISVIQPQQDFLEGLPLAKYATSDEMNITFIECQRRVLALRALYQEVNGYGRVLILNKLEDFPPEICLRWIVRVKRQGLSRDITKLIVSRRRSTLGAQPTDNTRTQSSLPHPHKRCFVSPLTIRIQGERTDILGTFSTCYVTQGSLGYSMQGEK